MAKLNILTNETNQYVKVFIQDNSDTVHRIATIPKTAGKHVDIESMVKAIQSGTKAAGEPEEKKG